jgi:DNA-binding PadR family transcriptional regulator
MDAGHDSPPLNPTAASLLGFLHDGPLTGWGLEQAVERSLGGFWNVTRSQIYRELRSLDAAGLVEPGEVGPRDRRPYRITDAGRRTFREWIARAPGEEVIRFPLLLWVHFMAHVEPGRMRRFLREHELVHLRRLDAYEEELRRIPAADASGPALTLRFGVEYERAVLRWFAALPDYDPVQRPGD